MLTGKVDLKILTVCQFIYAFMHVNLKNSLTDSKAVCKCIVKAFRNI